MLAQEIRTRGATRSSIRCEDICGDLTCVERPGSSTRFQGTRGIFAYTHAPFRLFGRSGSLFRGGLFERKLGRIAADSRRGHRH